MKSKKIYYSKKRSNGCYSAYNKTTKRYFAKCITKAKAKRQAKYIQNWFDRLYL
jgi:hypothetical protein